MSKKMTRIVCLILAALMILGLLTIVIPTRAVTQAEIDALETQRQAVRAQAADIQEQIDTLKDEIDSVTERKAVLDQETALNSESIRLIDQQIALYDEMIAEKGEEVDAALADEERQYNNYRSRVRTMEETNGWTYVAILLKATSLTDFLSRLNDISDIVRNDQNLTEEYTAARERVEQVKAEYEAVQAQQQDKRQELETEKARLERQVAQSTALIRQLEDDVENYESAYDEKQADIEEIQKKIDAKVEELRKQKEAEEAAKRAYEESLRKAEQERQRQQQQQQQQQSGSTSTGSSATTSSSGGGTVSGGGSGSSFSWPSNTTFLTSRFGYRVHPIFGTTKYHSGVDVGASYGSTVTAAAGGTVQISEYSSSYGNYCVIYHSNGVTTLYAHMNSLPSVKVGDTVSAGQTVGYVGSTGWATGPHLHFEVRVNGSSVDPLGYFPGMSFTYAADA